TWSSTRSLPFSGATVSSVVSFSVSDISLASSGRLFCLTLGHDREDAGDLALGELEARRVLERAGHGLEPQVEQLLAALREAVLQVVVRQLSQFPCPSQRAQPLSSQLWSSPTASDRQGGALPSRAAPVRRRARTSRGPA